MKTIAIYNHKGGISKTVTAVNFAYNLTREGYKVLVIDMDPQGNASSFFRRYDLNKPSVKNLLTGDRLPSRCIRKTGFPGLDIIQANFRLRDMEVSDLKDGIGTLRRVAWVYGSYYDFCIIDCPPSVDFMIETVMAAADQVIIPLKADRFSSDGLLTVKDIIDAFGSGRLSCRCLFTQFYRTKDTVRMIREIMDGNPELEFFDNVIRRSSAVDHSVSVCRPLLKCASKSTAAQDYMDFTREYLEREGKENGIA